MAATISWWVQFSSLCETIKFKLICVVCVCLCASTSAQYYSLVNGICQPSSFARFVGYASNMHYVPGVSSTTLTSEAACYSYCAANSPLTGPYTFQTYSYGTGSCICKFDASTIYQFFVASANRVENLVGNCAKYASTCKLWDYLNYNKVTPN